MPEEFLTVAAATVLALALLLVPGLAVVRLLRVGGLAATACAPACSLAVLAVGAVLADLLGVRWGLPAALGSLALAVALVLAVRRAIPRPAPTPPARRSLARRSLAPAVLVGLAVALVPVIAGIGRPAYLQRWDALFHTSALQHIHETGSASSLTLGALSYGDGRDAFYPAAWHALAALLPGTPTTAMVVGAAVGASVPWVLGCAALARTLWPGLPAAAPVAAVAAGIATSVPTSLWVGWGHVPNAVALASLPAVLALGIAVIAPRAPDAARVTGVRHLAAPALLLLVALAGLGTTHPNAVLAAGALLLPAVVVALVRSGRADHAAGRTTRAWLRPALGTLALLAVVGLFLASPVAGAVRAYLGGEPASLVHALIELVTGRYALWPSIPAALVTAPALLGAVLAARRRDPLPAAMLGIAWLLYADAVTGGRLGLAPLWYTSPARLSVVVAAVAVPLTAGLLAWLPGWARSRRRRGLARAVVLVVAVAALVAVAISAPVRSDRAQAVFTTEPGHPPQLVTTGELAMIAALPEQVGDRVVLGDPFSGAASAYALAGVRVVFPVAGQVLSPDQVVVTEGAEGIGSDPEVCAALERLDVRYLYQDTRSYQADNRFAALNTVEPPGARVVAEADTARVLELAPCDD